MISSQKLRVGYISKGKSQILFDDLHLHLKPGELVCFMGPNGIGKSTLLRTLAGLQKPLSGTIQGSHHQKVALVLTDRISASNMTVCDLVTYGRYPYLDWRISLSQADKKIIDDCIEQVHLGGLRGKKLDELSDGQMQLAMIARALAQQTPILLLDEPTAHLDLNNRVEIMNLLRLLSRNLDKAILATTHELDLALQTADQIWLATANQKIISGIPEDLVLNGSFDDVFQFKGFDLKTGKMDHEAHRKVVVQLVGEGYPYLWTKNALERSGYSVDSQTDLKISVVSEGPIKWMVGENIFGSISKLLEHLAKTGG